MEKRIYLDNNSTTPPAREAVEAMAEAARNSFGNPSSYHAFGADARLVVENARIGAARFIGASPSEIVFVSSGTEANNLAIFGIYNHFRLSVGKRRMNIVTTAVEHHSVASTLSVLALEGVEIRTVGVSADCRVDPGDFRKAMDGDTVLVCCMMANNETGAIFPVKAIGEICRERGKLLFTDAVCAAGKIRFGVNETGCDLLSFSSHKIYGPKGAACLYIRRGVEILPRTVGGHQENDRRAGTESVPAIAGLGAACSFVSENLDRISERCLKMKRTFVEKIRGGLPEAVINCEGASPSLPNTVSLTLPFSNVHEANGFLFSLDIAGLCVSTGAACASMASEPSHVLLAMGRDPLSAQYTLRVSFGWGNSDGDAEEAAGIICDEYKRVRKIGACL